MVPCSGSVAVRGAGTAGSMPSAGAAGCREARPRVFRRPGVAVPLVQPARRAAGRFGEAPRRLRRRAGALVLLAALAFADETPAVTIAPGGTRTWSQPGTNPCRDLCHPDWALARMRALMPRDVHDELVRRLAASVPVGRHYVSTGDRIVAMSYAKRGVPFVEIAERVAQFPSEVRYEARGYAVAYDGLLYRFIRIAACGNWALLVAPLAMPPAAVSPDSPLWLGVPGIGGFGTVLLPHKLLGDPQRQEFPTSMPPPATLVLLASAVAALSAPRLLRGQGRMRGVICRAAHNKR